MNDITPRRYSEEYLIQEINMANKEMQLLSNSPVSNQRACDRYTDAMVRHDTMAKLLTMKVAI